MATQPILNDYLTSTPAPLDTNIHALMTYNSGYDDASNLFYRQQKMDLLGKIAGKKVNEDEVVWCDDETCSLDFPVDMAVWTANALMGLGIWEKGPSIFPNDLMNELSRTTQGERMRHL